MPTVKVSYLVDTSAFMRLLLQPEVAQAWSAQVDAGLLTVCPLTELEILFTAQSVAHRQELQRTLRDLYTWVLVPERAFDRAAAVQADLAHLGMHRSAGPIDLLVAATAEHHRLTVLHYDRDFTRVAQVTDQAMRWVADPGAVD